MLLEFLKRPCSSHFLLFSSDLIPIDIVKYRTNWKKMLVSVKKPAMYALVVLILSWVSLGGITLLRSELEEGQPDKPVNGN